MLFKVSISAEKIEPKVRLLLESNREAVNAGIKLRKKNKKTAEKCQFVEEAPDAWFPACRGAAQLPRFHFLRGSIYEGWGSARTPILSAGDTCTGARCSSSFLGRHSHD